VDAQRISTDRCLHPTVVEMERFASAQPAGVERVQADAIARQPHMVQHALDVVAAQHRRESCVLGWPDAREARPLTLECVLKEACDATPRDGHTGA